MKPTSVLGGSAFSFSVTFAVWVAFAVFCKVDVAWAQSVCSCPAGTVNLGNGHCDTISCPAHHHLSGGECWPDREDHHNEDHNNDGHNNDESHYDWSRWSDWYHHRPHPLSPIHTLSNGSCTSAVPSVGQIVAGQQQQSFFAVSGVLQGRRDALQGGVTPPRPSAAMGYAPADLDGSPGLLGYAPDKQKNPLSDVPAPPAPAFGPTWATWVEGMGNWEKRNALNQFDVGRTQDTYSTHAGVDATWANPFLTGDYLVTGLVTNYSSAQVDLVNGAKLHLEGPGGGLYGMYINGGFSADVVGKIDYLTLKEDLSALGLSDGSIGITAAGAAGNVQYKYKFAWGFIEPTMGFAFTRVMFGDDRVAMGLQDGSTLRLQAGARFGGAFQINGVSIEPTIALLAYSNVIADSTSLATVDVPVPVTPTDKGLVRGEVDPELNFNFDNGYSAYIRGSFYAGTELIGGAAKIGLRKEF
jgi:hypothetical protein